MAVDQRAARGSNYGAGDRRSIAVYVNGALVENKIQGTGSSLQFDSDLVGIGMFYPRPEYTR